MASSASSRSVGAQCVRYSLRDKGIAAGVGTGVGVCVGAMVGVGVGAAVGMGVAVGVCVGAMVGVGSGVGVFVGAVVEAGVGAAVGMGVAVGVCVGAVVGVGVGADVTPGCAVTVGLGTALAVGVGVGAPVHPASSMARSIATAPSKPSAMDFDMIALLDARVSTTDASTVAFRMTRRKVRLYLLKGALLYPSDKVRSNLAAVVERRTLIALVEA